jgi:hypothetical protein
LSRSLSLALSIAFPGSPAVAGTAGFAPTAAFGASALFLKTAGFRATDGFTATPRFALSDEFSQSPEFTPTAARAAAASAAIGQFAIFGGAGLALLAFIIVAVLAVKKRRGRDSDQPPETDTGPTDIWSTMELNFEDAVSASFAMQLGEFENPQSVETRVTAPDLWAGPARVARSCSSNKRSQSPERCEISPRRFAEPSFSRLP